MERISWDSLILSTFTSRKNKWSTERPATGRDSKSLRRDVPYLTILSQTPNESLTLHDGYLCIVYCF